jgi:hypothetical protein
VWRHNPGGHQGFGDLHGADNQRRCDEPGSRDTAVRSRGGRSRAYRRVRAVRRLAAFRGDGASGRVGDYEWVGAFRGVSDFERVGDYERVGDSGRVSGRCGRTLPGTRRMRPG